MKEKSLLVGRLREESLQMSQPEKDREESTGADRTELRSLLVDQPSVATTIQTAVGRLEDNLEAKVDTLAGDLRRTLSAGMTQAAAGSASLHLSSLQPQIAGASRRTRVRRVQSAAMPLSHPLTQSCRRRTATLPGVARHGMW